MPFHWSADNSDDDRLPAGLYVVGTPIGNLGDITLRALDTLQRADLVAAEDTRRTGRLLSHYGIRKKLISCHEHNEAQRAAGLAERVRGGAALALVTDAGMPSVSDPGYALVVHAVAAGLPVVPVPGVSAVTTALSVSALPTDSFLFAGFPPRRTPRRRRFLSELSAENRTLVFFESPRRIAALLADVHRVLGDRRAVLAREMTKRYEEFLRGTVSELLRMLEERPSVRGELTLLVASGGGDGAPGDEALDREIAAAMARGLPVSEISRRVAVGCGVSRKRVYRRALAMARERGAAEPGGEDVS